MKQADLNPSLGWRGGPCKVVDRIEQRVRQPALREDLAEKVEHGQKLTNPEAARIYSIEGEKGGGIFRSIKITPHTQYRMDLRGVTVGDLRVALQNFSRQLNDWKSRNSWEWQQFQNDTARGEPIEWVDKKLGDLEVVFRNERGIAIIITTYWKGLPDPHPETCGLRSQRHAGYYNRRSESVSEIIRKWQDEGDELYDDSQPVMVPLRDIVKYREYRWTRETSRGGYAKVNGKSVLLDGPLKWDAIKADMKLRGWDPKEPMHVMIGRKGGVKVGEGNHRLAIAIELRLSQVPVFFHFYEDRVTKSPLPKQKPVEISPRAVKEVVREAPREKMTPEKEKQIDELMDLLGFRGAALTPAEMSGYRTWVKDPTPEKSDTDTGRYPTRGLPDPPWGGHTNPVGPQRFNVPGESGSNSDGNIHKDKARTKGLPGEESPPSDAPARNTPVRRPGMTADGDLLDDFVLALREASKRGFLIRQRPVKRRHKLRGIEKAKAKRRYRKNRLKSKMRSRRRYKRLKNNPAFKKQQQIRRKHPERFKMRMGGLLTAPEIAFAMYKGGDQMLLGYVHSISGMTGLVNFWLAEPGQRMLMSLPVREFLLVATFLSDEDMDAMYTLIDAEVGIEAYDDPEEVNTDLVNLFTLDSDFMHLEDEYQRDDLDEVLIDPGDDDLFYGVVNKLASRVVGTFFREQRPPEMDPDTVYDRADDKDKRKRRDRKPGDSGLLGPYEDEVHDSNPGSRVFPGGKDHVEKSAKGFNFRALPRGHQQAVFDLIKSPLWKKYKRGHGRDIDILAWLRERGWEGLSLQGMWRLFDQISLMNPAAARTAALIREIREGCAPILDTRAEGIRSRLVRSDIKNAVWLFDVPGSKGESYRVRLKAQRRGNVLDIQKIHIKVSCSCPFWRWQGPEYHAKQGGYLYGRPQGSATKPDVKDPNSEHRACKHVLACFNFVTDRKWMLYPPKVKAASLRYLADISHTGEMGSLSTEFDLRSRKVVARYLTSLEVQDA